MDIPFELREAIENMVEGKDLSQIKKTVKDISGKYKNNSGRGKVLINSDNDAQVYSCFRMPATYGACYDAFSYVKEFFNGSIGSVTDVGAGTGAASWAVDRIFDPKSIRCLEREISMRKIGQELMNADKVLQDKTSWESYDLLSDDVNESSDLTISSYVFNELDPNNVIKAITKLWDKTDKLMRIVEPGTVEGYNVIKMIREHLISLGGNVVAPCPHMGSCDLKDDWCHFACRVQRSKLHKIIKEGDVPYEDEKYSFIAVSREETPRTKCRVLRHPYINKGQIDLTVCTPDGKTNMTVRKRDGDIFKKARKCKQGDSLIP